MKRLIKIQGSLGNEEKFVLREEYEGFGIYEEKCPSGYFVHQSWLITNENTTVVIPSYNNMCKEELLDMIDNYNENKKFEIKAINRGNGTYIMHNSGNII